MGVGVGVAVGLGVAAEVAFGLLALVLALPGAEGLLKPRASSTPPPITAISTSAATIASASVFPRPLRAGATGEYCAGAAGRGAYAPGGGKPAAGGGTFAAGALTAKGAVPDSG